MDTETILERRRLRRRASFWRVSAFAILAAAVIALVGITSDLDGLEPGLGGQIAEIRVDGFIETRPEAVELIEAATKSKSVRAILLRIDSPGGAASGGESLFRAVRKASTDKPVVAVIDGLGASAAYMTAIAADHIVARESAITGSIGVIFQYGHFEALLDKIGAEYEEVKSAPLKGEPSLFREPHPEAVEMLQGVVDDTYDWFVRLVAERRDLPLANARQLADGSIYTGGQALRLKLIDAIGDTEEARAWLASERGIAKDLPVRRWEEERPLFALLSTDALAGLARVVGIDVSGGAALLPRRLAVDGLMSVWHASPAVRSER
ncbi:MAG TPA: signal peptide peptidase SppA [Propylenella sp.]|nr:signal peptide peptidase SppA [Propylenella sp.]